MKKELLRLENIFTNSNSSDLYNFNLEVYTGQIVGIMSINELGQDKLIRAIEDIKNIYKGRIYIMSECINYKLEKNIYRYNYIVERSSKLVNALSIAANVFEVTIGGKNYINSEAKLRIELSKIMQEYGVYINPRKNITSLSTYERLVVEVLKSIVLNKGLIIVESIEGLLTQEESYNFFKFLKGTVKVGKAVIYISNNLNELNQLCNEIVLMKDGTDVKCYSVDEIPIYRQQMMIDKLCNNKFIEKVKGERKGTINITFNSEIDNRQYSITIKKGECITVIQKDARIVQGIKNLLIEDKKEISVYLEIGKNKFKGEEIIKMLGTKIIFLNERPFDTFLFNNLSYLENLSILLGEDNTYSLKKIKKAVCKEIYPILGKEIYQRNIQNISSIQKYNLIYYKIYLLTPYIIFVVDPFRGESLEAKNHITRLIQQLKKRGISIIIFSPNIIEYKEIQDDIIKW